MEAEDDSSALLDAISDELQSQRRQGVSRSAAVRTIVELFSGRNIKKSMVYDMALKMKWTPIE